MLLLRCLSSTTTTITTHAQGCYDPTSSIESADRLWIHCLARPRTPIVVPARTTPRRAASGPNDGGRFIFASRLDRQRHVVLRPCCAGLCVVVEWSNSAVTNMGVPAGLSSSRRLVRSERCVRSLDGKPIDLRTTSCKSSPRPPIKGRPSSPRTRLPTSRPSTSSPRPSTSSSSLPSSPPLLPPSHPSRPAPSRSARVEEPGRTATVRGTIALAPVRNGGTRARNGSGALQRRDRASRPKASTGRRARRSTTLSRSRVSSDF